ncbi:MAG: glycosyltransferase family 39 protein [candidate division WOR-3 bacterium]|nr:MAG: glycosyltransferase family 39 protein [candidate division WOR-3 bacterium]
MKPAQATHPKQNAGRPGWLVVPGLLLLAAGALTQYLGPTVIAYGGLFQIPLSNGFFYFSPWLVLIGVLAGLLLLALLFRDTRRFVLAPWRSRKTRWLLLLLVLTFGFTLLPWGYPKTYGPDTGSSLVGYLALSSAGLVLVLAGAWNWLGFLDRPARRVYDLLMRLDRRVLLLGTFAFVLLVANIVSLLRFEHLAHVPDSISQLFQARIFAEGKLYLASPRFPDFFDYTHIINNGQWYSQYLFLHSLLLVPFVKLGIPWLLNPLLGAITPAAVYLLGRELYDERTGRLACLLTAVSPFLLNMSAEYMNHSSTLLFVTLFSLFFFRTLRLGRWYEAAAACLFLGLAFNIRPFTAVATSLPFAVFLYLTQRDPRATVRRFLPGIVILVLLASLILLYNWLTNGDPLLLGYVVKWGSGHEIGFGRSGWGAQHTPFRGLVNTGNNLNGLNKNLFEWPVPGLLPLFALLFSGSANRRDWLLFTSFASLVVAYFFYWYQDLTFGPRFLFGAMAFLVLLTIRGFDATPAFLRRLFRANLSGGTWPRFLGRSLPLVLLLPALISIPPLYIQKYNNYFGFTGTVLNKVRQAGLKDALVFCLHFGPGFNGNSLDLDGDVVYAKDFGLLNSALTISYPDRQCFYANKDTLRPLPGIGFPESRLKRALEEMARFIAVELPEDCRTVVWPFGDIPPPGWARRGAALASVELVDFRQLSREIFSGEKELDDYLPATACWMLDDGREHLRIFAFMSDLQNYIADRYKFTLLHVSVEGTAAIYDIRLATGDEALVGYQRGAMPVR